MDKQQVLLIGSGGREHALAWALVRSPLLERLYVAPGNAGTAHIATNVPVGVEDRPGLLRLAQEKEVDLVIVGPEAPLAAGIADELAAAGIAVFGPGREAAQIEASKAFAKAFMQQHNIPTAPAEQFDDFEAARDYLADESFPAGVVVKASGLAAGKGVFVCDTFAEAEAALEQLMLGRLFGPAGETVLIEERLEGPELSVLAFCDGKRVVPLPAARDHKRAYDGDEGPNTGGMGAYAPAPDLPPGFVEEIVRAVLQPTVDGLAARGTPYVGVLYAGLMLTAEGPRVLEFNCRFGDPEAQAILPLLSSDLLELVLACVQGRLDEVELVIRPGACATVVMAAQGYPGDYAKGVPVHGVDEAAQLSDLFVFHAGTALQDGRLVTAGGRVLAVSGLGTDLPAAVERAYEGVARIRFAGAHYRRDIGRRSGA